MPPMNHSPNQGIAMTQKHAEIEKAELERISNLYREVVGVTPRFNMTPEDIEKGIENPEEEKTRLLAESREENSADIKKYHHA